MNILQFFVNAKFFPLPLHGSIYWVYNISMEKQGRFSNKTVEGDPYEKVLEKQRGGVKERDEEVEKVCRRLAAEGYQFEMSIPNESEIILKVGGKHFTYSKKIGTDELIEKRIIEFAPKIEKE